MENITLKLENFEGPLSLLYHLIEKNKVDIYDIPIAEITRQYMEVIYNAEIMDMDVMSSFLVMASTLMEIKSKLLLPKVQSEDSDEPDPREELVNRLIEYKKYCEFAKMLKEKESKYSQRLFKQPDKALSEIKSEYSMDIDSFMNGITFDDLINAFKTVMERKDLKTDKIRSGFKSVTHDEFTIEEKINYLKELLYLTPKMRFKEVFTRDTTKAEVAVTFLALLELIKTGFMIISQNINFGDIIITKNQEVQI